MTLCDYCGKEIESEKLEPVGRIITGGSYDVKSSPISLPFDCLRCGGKYCSSHRLPEAHECKNIELLTNTPRKAYLDDTRTSYKPSKIDRNPEREYETCAYCGNSKATYNVTYQRCNICNKYYCFLHREPKRHNCHVSVINKSLNALKSFIGLIFAIVIIFVLFSYFGVLDNFVLPTNNLKPTPDAIEYTNTGLKQSIIPPTTSIEELRNYALQLINEDRKKYGLNSVTLGNNKAAQQHADDMLINRFLSHWGSDGLKPYMRYTKEGGHGGVAENAAFSGFFDYEPNAATIVPKDAIKNLQYSMMYEDAKSNWGHRDNIIDKNHNKVNIGIAYDNTHLAYVQDFEDDYISWSNPFTYSSETLSMAGTTSIGTVESIALYYDPLPQSLLQSQLLDSTHSGSYGLGDEAGYILKPPPQGARYDTVEMNYKYVVASTWSVSNSGSFSISANIQPLLYKGKGVYTVVIWAKKGNDDITLTTYSLFVN